MEKCKCHKKDGNRCNFKPSKKPNDNHNYCGHHQDCSNPVTNTPTNNPGPSIIPIPNVPIKTKKTYPNGDKYEGYMLNDKPHGIGTMRYSDGEYYTGEWNNNKYVKGTKEYKNGTTYKGTWINNQYDTGKLTFFSDEDYKSFEGTFLNNNDANGTLIYVNGNKYTGELIYYANEFILNGQGTMNYNNGRKYEGEWYQNYRHGHGKLTQPNGMVQYGDWYFNEYKELDEFKQHMATFRAKRDINPSKNTKSTWETLCSKDIKNVTELEWKNLINLVKLANIPTDRFKDKTTKNLREMCLIITTYSDIKNMCVEDFPYVDENGEQSENTIDNEKMNNKINILRKSGKEYKGNTGDERITEECLKNEFKCNRNIAGNKDVYSDLNEIPINNYNKNEIFILYDSKSTTPKQRQKDFEEGNYYCLSSLDAIKMDINNLKNPITNEPIEGETKDELMRFIRSHYTKPELNDIYIPEKVKIFNEYKNQIEYFDADRFLYLKIKDLNDIIDILNAENNLNVKHVNYKKNMLDVFNDFFDNIEKIGNFSGIISIVNEIVNRPKFQQRITQNMTKFI